MLRGRVTLWMCLALPAACGALPVRVCAPAEGPCSGGQVVIGPHAHDDHHDDHGPAGDPADGAGGREACCADSAFEFSVSGHAVVLDVPSTSGATLIAAPPAPTDAVPARPGTTRVPRESDPVVLLR